MPDDERDFNSEKWLNDKLDEVNALGSDIRKAFDQLVVEINPDCGPAWLDRLIQVEWYNLECDDEELKQEGAARDLVKLAQAMTALEILIDRLDRAA